MNKRYEELSAPVLILVATILIVEIIFSLIKVGFNREHDSQGDKQMEETQATTERPEVDTKALLAAAAIVPKGKKLKKYNPMEEIPTLAVGDLPEGQIIAGTFVRTETLASHKFTMSPNKNEQGVPTQDRHILRLTDGKLMAIWTTGELRMVFGKLPEGSLITLTYKGKGKNNKGQQQHFFDFQIEESSNLN